MAMNEVGHEKLGCFSHYFAVWLRDGGSSLGDGNVKPFPAFEGAIEGDRLQRHSH